MKTGNPSYTATKAHFGGAISGGLTAALRLVLHALGVVELADDMVAALVQAVAEGAAIGVVTWLGIYGSPANREK